MYLIYQCLSSASAVIRSWFVYELQKSIHNDSVFKELTLHFSTPEIQPEKSPPCLRISNRKYPPCPQNSIIVNPPSPSEILKAVRGIGIDMFWNRPLYKTNRFHVAVRLFSNRSQKTSKCGKNISDTLGYASCSTFLFLPHFDVICDLLMNRRTATWNLFVK